MQRYDEGLKLIASASKAEDLGKNKEAYDQYIAGIDILLSKLKTETKDDIKCLVRKHLSKFMDTAEALRSTLPPQNAESQALKDARDYENKARSYEKALKLQLALDAYVKAADLYRTCRRNCSAETEEYTVAGRSALAMIERAESLQRVLGGQTRAPQPEAAPRSPARSDSGQVLSGGLPNNLVGVFANSPPAPSDEEKRVLQLGSSINGRTYDLMFSPDANFSNFQGEDWRDPAGLPKLCPKQKAAGAVWARPGMFMERPVLISRLSHEHITQTVIGDCSFVSSLALCAAWEHRFRRTLISQNIYPQVNGQPVLSPSGRYVIKMLLNGAVRKVEVDDFLPVTPVRPVKLLCTFSEAGELWVCLFEKAYMKLHGGYAFPGSTSSIDLHALCGWIPETFRLGPPGPDGDAEAEECWRRLVGGVARGTGLFTVGTRGLDPDEEARSGLVPRHAYAVLDAREACGRRAVRLKNPWCHTEWRGALSDGDAAGWTPELRAALGRAADEPARDDGVFWMPWEAVRHFFGCLHASWTPARFRHRAVAHGRLVKTAPDRHHRDACPQLLLRLAEPPPPDGDPTLVWVLFQRHLGPGPGPAQPRAGSGPAARRPGGAGGDEEEGDEEFVAVHVHRGAEKAYWPEGAEASGTYTDSPHALVRVELGGRAGPAAVLVVSALAAAARVGFSVTAYSLAPCALGPVPQYPPYVDAAGVQAARARWEGAAAGGCPNHASFPRNPAFVVRLGAAAGGGAGGTVWCKLVVDAEGEGEGEGEGGAAGEAVGMHLLEGEPAPRAEDLARMPRVAPLSDDTTYRAGLALREWPVSAGGAYTLVCSTFRPAVAASFRVYVAASLPLRLSRAPAPQ